MADNVTLPGTGSSIATDEVTDGTLGTVQVQFAKIMDGTLDSTNKLIVDSSGRAKVDASGVAVPVTDNSGSLTVDNAGTFAVQATVAAGASTIAKAEDAASADGDVGVPAMAIRKATPANTSNADGDYEMLQISAGRLWTSATIDAALPAGTNAIGKLASNSGVTIGAVEIAASQTLSTVSTVSTLTGGGVAHASADSGNPHKIGAKVKTSPKGLTLASADNRTDLYADADGMLMVKLNTSLADVVSERVTITTGTSTAFTNFSAVASTRNYVTSIVVYNSSSTAGYIDFRDGTAGSVLWTMPVPAGGGSVLSSAVPLFKTSANTALAYQVSGSLSTVYISVSGFQSKAG